MLPTEQDDPVVARITTGLPPVLPSLAKPQTTAGVQLATPISAGLPPVTATAPSPEEQRVAQVRSKLQSLENKPTFTEGLWDRTKGSDSVIGKIGHVGAGILRGVDIAGEALAPGLASAIPGTSMNKRLNEQITGRQLGTAENQAVTARKTPETQAFEGQEKAGRTPLQAYAETEAAKRAPTKPDKAENLGQEITDRSVAAQAEGRDPNEDPNVLQLIDVNTRMQREPANPQDRYMKSQKMVGGKLHDVMTNERTKEQTDLGETKQPGAGSGGAGPWLVDPQGRFYRASVGGTMPEGSQTVSGVAGTETKKVQSTNAAGEAATYAKTYQASNQFTGPGDEALMEKFFELAKPSSGFRMTQNQMDMLLKARSWMEGAIANGYHAAHGTYFSNEQRKQIADTMSNLQTAKGGTKGAGTEFHNFTYNGQRYENVPDETYKKVKGKPGFSE